MSTDEVAAALDAKWATRTSLTTVIAAEGARIGIVTCLDCGAALMIDPRDSFDGISAHMAWHDSATNPD